MGYQVWLYNYNKRACMTKHITIYLLYFGHVGYMTNYMATILIAVQLKLLEYKSLMDERKHNTTRNLSSLHSEGRGRGGGGYGGGGCGYCSGHGQGRGVL